MASTDDIDRQILDLLRKDARAPISEIARRVGLSAAPVSRRIERMQNAGVIRGYMALIDDHLAGTVEAFTEVRLAGGTETGELNDIVRAVPEVQEFYTIAGDSDALVRLRVNDVDHLQRVVNALRRTGKLTGTKTWIVMHTWNRNQEASLGRPFPTTWFWSTQGARHPLRSHWASTCSSPTRILTRCDIGASRIVPD